MLKHIYLQRGENQGLFSVLAPHRLQGARFAARDSLETGAKPFGARQESKRFFAPYSTPHSKKTLRMSPSLAETLQAPALERPFPGIRVAKRVRWTLSKFSGIVWMDISRAELF